MTTVKSLLSLLLLPVIFIIMFCITNFAPNVFGQWSDVIMRYVFIVYTGFFIIDQMVNEKAFLKLKSQPFLIYTGKISYGLYCFHGIVLTFGMIVLQKLEINMPSILRVLLFLAVNYLVASISYQFVEKPFLKLKDKLRRA